MKNFSQFLNESLALNEYLSKNPQHPYLDYDWYDYNREEEMCVEFRPKPKQKMILVSINTVKDAENQDQGDHWCQFEITYANWGKLLKEIYKSVKDDKFESEIEIPFIEDKTGNNPRNTIELTYETHIKAGKEKRWVHIHLDWWDYTIPLDDTFIKELKQLKLPSK